MGSWFWNRSRKPPGVTAGCLVSAEGLSPAPRHAPDQVGPEEPLSSQNPLANCLCELFQSAKQKEADTLGLALDRAKGNIRIQSKGSGAWEQIPGLPEYFWSGLVFTCLRGCAIESCQGTIQDPASGESWRFTFRQDNNEIQLSRIGKDV